MENIQVLGKDVCYNFDVPTSNKEKLSEPVLLNLTPTIFKELLEIEEREDRRRGYIARELMLRGLALYRIDGLLKDRSPGEGPRLRSSSITRKHAAQITKNAAFAGEWQKRLSPTWTNLILFFRHRTAGRYRG